MIITKLVLAIIASFASMLDMSTVTFLDGQEVQIGHKPIF